MSWAAHYWKITNIDANFAEDGRVTTPNAASRNYYPYTELHKIGEGGFGKIFKAERDGKFYIAKHQELKNTHIIRLYEW